MQSGDAYIQQVPAGAPPPHAQVAPLHRTFGQGSPPAGLYVQIADVGSQAEAVRASLDLSQRLGPARPPFIRGVVAQTPAGARILMFGGPFGDVAAARAFCEAALGSAPCLTHTFERATAKAAKADR